MKLVNPANKRKYTIIVVGTGLAGASAAASLAELGYNVLRSAFRIRPAAPTASPLRAASTPPRTIQTTATASGGCFTTPSKGGDFRSREANVYRLAQISNLIIDQCGAQGVPFAREYGGTLANRSFGGAQVSRTFYARGQTGQQLLLGAYSAHDAASRPRQGDADSPPRDARSRGRRRHGAAASSPAIWSPADTRHYAGDAVVLCTGGYGNVFYLSTNAKSCNVTAVWRVP